jgi:nitrogen fixation protein FixH
MKDTPKTIEQREHEARFIPWMIVAFFVLLTILLGNFVWIAISTNPGLVTEDAFKKGLAYNTIIDAQKKQDALGWQTTTAVSGTFAQAKISFTLLDKHKRPINDAVVEATFVRPAAKAKDIKLSLSHVGKGVYKGDVMLPAQGLWEVHVTAQKNADNYQAVTRTQIP